MASFLMSEGFSLWEIPWGESCSYISFSSIYAAIAAASAVPVGAIFLPVEKSVYLRYNEEEDVPQLYNWGSS